MAREAKILGGGRGLPERDHTLPDPNLDNIPTAKSPYGLPHGGPRPKMTKDRRLKAMRLPSWHDPQARYSEELIAELKEWDEKLRKSGIDDVEPRLNNGHLGDRMPRMASEMARNYRADQEEYYRLAHRWCEAWHPLSRWGARRVAHAAVLGSIKAETARHRREVRRLERAYRTLVTTESVSSRKDKLIFKLHAEGMDHAAIAKRTREGIRRVQAVCAKEASAMRRAWCGPGGNPEDGGRIQADRGAPTPKRGSGCDN